MTQNPLLLHPEDEKFRSGTLPEFSLLTRLTETAGGARGEGAMLISAPGCPGRETP